MAAMALSFSSIADAQTKISPTTPDWYKITPPPDPKILKADNACAMFTPMLQTKLIDERLNEFIKQCNDDPDPQTCQGAIGFLRRNHIAVPKALDCHGRGQTVVESPPPPPEAPGPTEDFDNARATTVALLQANLKDPQFDELVQKCSHHPDRTVCDGTASYIRGAGIAIPPALKCGQ